MGALDRIWRYLLCLIDTHDWGWSDRIVTECVQGGVAFQERRRSADRCLRCGRLEDRPDEVWIRRQSRNGLNEVGPRSGWL
jgi:hypothetical protein